MSAINRLKELARFHLRMPQQHNLSSIRIVAAVHHPGLLPYLPTNIPPPKITQIHAARLFREGSALGFLFGPFFWLISDFLMAFN